MQNPGVSTEQDIHGFLLSTAMTSMVADMSKIFTQHPALLRKVRMELSQLFGQLDPPIGQDDCTLAALIAKVLVRL